VWDGKLRGSERLIFLGVLIAIIGFFIIAISGSSTEAGFFFIFPFFIIGDFSGPLMIIIAASITVMFLLFFFLPLRNLTHELEDSRLNEVPKYVRIASQCEYCSRPIPEESTFCPSCGNPLRECSSDRYEPMY
jgi:hypothetical protein